MPGVQHEAVINMIRFRNEGSETKAFAQNVKDLFASYGLSCEEVQEAIFDADRLLYLRPDVFWMDTESRTIKVWEVEIENPMSSSKLAVYSSFSDAQIEETTLRVFVVDRYGHETEIEDLSVWWLFLMEVSDAG